MSRIIRMPVWCALLIAGTALAQEQWRPVTLRLPASVPASAVITCAADSGGAALRVEPGTTAAFDAMCSIAGAVRCSLPEAEPVDFDMAALCRGAVGVVQPAVRLLTLTAPAAESGIVEWRAWGDAVSYALATRQYETLSAAALPVADDARLMRIHRTGSSPVTLMVPAADASPVDLAVTVPAARRGGEVFLMFGERERAESTVTITGTDTRIIGIGDAPFVSIPGMPAGDYTLRFGTPDVPTGPPIDFSVRDASTTEFAPRLPAAANEYRISGVVTFNGSPMERQALEVMSIATDQVQAMTTDDKGRYNITVPTGGAYLVRVVSTYDFGHIETSREIELGENVMDLDLAGSVVRLSFYVNGGAPERSVEFTLDGPQRFGGIASDFSQPTELFAIPFGTYLIRANMEPDYVAEARSVVIDGTAGARTVTLDLGQQTATLVVRDDNGAAVANARARAGLQLLRATGSGMVDVRRVSTGVPIIVRAPGRVPTCLVLQPNMENVATLRSAVAPLEIRYDVETLRSPPGQIRFNPADQCAVPLEDFEWSRVTAGFSIINLPNGAEVTYEYGARAFLLKAPGETVVIR